MKKIGFLAISISGFVFACGISSQVQAQPAPLSCKVQMLLTGTTALLRDKGVTRKNAKIANDPNTDLTKKEIKSILDRVYVTGKNQTPEQISEDVYKRCENSTSASVPPTSSCEVMAQMGQDTSNLRDAGVPLNVVEKRLRQEVSDPQELALGITVVRLVYQTNGTGQQLKKEILKKCNKSN